MCTNLFVVYDPCIYTEMKKHGHLESRIFPGMLSLHVHVSGYIVWHENPSESPLFPILSMTLLGCKVSVDVHAWLHGRHKPSFWAVTSKQVPELIIWDFTAIINHDGCFDANGLRSINVHFEHVAQCFMKKGCSMKTRPWYHAHIKAWWSKKPNEAITPGLVEVWTPSPIFWENPRITFPGTGPGKG